MEESEEKFEDMDAYSRKDAYASDEWGKIYQFRFGLIGEINYSVAQRDFNTYVAQLR